MAEVIWTEPALQNLDAIFDYIALEHPAAARALLQRVFQHVERLANHPRLGPKHPELRGSRVRQIVETPCRVLYRDHDGRVVILHVMRVEQPLRAASMVSHRHEPSV